METLRATRGLIGPLLILQLGAVSAAGAAEIEGVRFAERISGPTTLELHRTALLRFGWVLKVYVAGLYLGEGVAPEEVLQDVPKRLEIEYFRGFRAEQFAAATRHKIAENLDAESYAALEPRIEALNRLYRDISPGDRYALTYVPERGTELSLNGESLGVIPGADLAAGAFSIWLGESPLDRPLKQELLGLP